MIEAKFRLYLIVSNILFTLDFNNAQRSPDEWKSRVVYQILTDRFSVEGSSPTEKCNDLSKYCGGVWKGVEQRLDYIQALGMNAIWISPIVQNVPDGYHGYWAKNLFQVNEQFGSEQDLRDLVQACHDRDIWLMVDVVPNHMGYPDGCTWPEPPGEECTKEKLTNFTGLTPFNGAEHYHSFCVIQDYDNQTQVELCRLANLPDLNQTVPEVSKALYDWISNLTSTYGFDGYRVDTVKHITISFWGDYQKAAGSFCMGEVFSGDPSYVAVYQEYMDAVFNFPSLLTLQGVFHDGRSMTELANNLIQQRQVFRDVSVLGILADNHDFPRFLNRTYDVVQLRNALTYVFIGEGIPFLYYGTEQAFHGGADPLGRESLWPFYDQQSEMYQWISSLATYRLDHLEDLANSTQREIYVDADTLVFTRADDKYIATVSKLGNGNNGTVDITGLDGANNKVYTNIFDENDQVVVQNGQLLLHIVNGEPLVYVSS